MATFFKKSAACQSRFWYIGGLTSDEFYTADGMRLNLQQLLFQELKEAGYDRIIFYNSRNSMYCFDEHSFDLLTHRKKDEPTQQTYNEMSQGVGLKKGAWGKQQGSMSNNSPIAERTVSVKTKLHSGMKDNIAILHQFEGMLNNSDVNEDEPYDTAVVIDDADDFLKVTSRENVGWQKFINDMSRLPSENSNIMVFIFPDNKLDN